MENRPEKFLKAIADAYCAEYETFTNGLSEVCFVFPNKRGGTFFLEYLHESNRGKGFMAPEITTISDFVENLSGRVIDSRVDLLLRLYRVYCDYLNSHSHDASKIIADSIGVKEGAAVKEDMTVDFDSFRIWGEMVLADFNDIEMYMVDTSQIFKNIKDNREIESTYLSEEQIEVMQTYFGVSNLGEHLTNFWYHYNNPKPIKENKKKFFKLWEILSPLYHEFCASLERDHLTFSGLAYRQALDNIRSYGAKVLPYKRVVFVGFNALSTVEWSIFTAIKKIRIDGASMADFYWDYTDGPMSQEGNTAGHFVGKNKEYFPSRHVGVAELTNVHGLIAEELKVISSPSGVAQAKIIGDLLKGIYQEVGAEGFNKRRVAVVLPDEGLLMPLLYSLPEYFTNDKNKKWEMSHTDTKAAAVNITMGYSLKNTSAAALVSLLRKLQMRKKLRNGEWEFMRDDVIDLVSHPFVRIMLTNAVADEVLKQLSRNKRIVLKARSLMKISKALPGSRETIGRSVERSGIFTPLSDNHKDSAVTYVKQLLDTAIKAVTAYYADVEGYSELEIVHLKLYLRAVKRLSDALDAYHIKANVSSVFSLMDKLLGGETITFEGEPLEGLQIMGPLETRCLDFDYLIIPSMNERIYPRKLHSHTFIPNSLRYGYGMATTRYQESIFAYNFYRMISRAKKVYMIYDARNEGLKTGDVSRYVMQLRYLYAKNRLTFANYRFSIESSDNETVVIPKTGKVSEMLHRYFTDQGDRSYFSASALRNYVNCPMNFCLSKVMKIKEKDEPEDFLSASSVGTIVHAVMADLYLPDRTMQGHYLGANAVTITDKYIDDLTDEHIDTIIRRAVCEEKIWNRHDDKGRIPVPTTLPDGLEVYMDSLRAIIRRALVHDKTLTPLQIYGTEIDEQCMVDMGNGVKANVTFIIDRMDKPAESEHMRIVDYKTGEENVDIQDVADCFTLDKEKGVAMQLLLYAKVFIQNHPEIEDFNLEIYNLQKEKISTPLRLQIAPRKYAEKRYRECEPEFSNALLTTLGNIHNETIPFTQAALTSQSCTYCVFRSAICNR